MVNDTSTHITSNFTHAGQPPLMYTGICKTRQQETNMRHAIDKSIMPCPLPEHSEASWQHKTSRILNPQIWLYERPPANSYSTNDPG